MRIILALAIALGLCGGTAFAQASGPSSATMPVCASSDPVVWVNTSSNVYHMKGSKYYGKTKAGKYQCKSAADAGGSRQAQNEGKKPSSNASPNPNATMKPKKGHKPPATPAPMPMTSSAPMHMATPAPQAT